ncbi:hypothetical protein OG21DRAFT_1517830 [Imleria badia]|nr:hypothetical protein OG21DRAFT_1517830 [Imleria badia]
MHANRSQKDKTRLDGMIAGVLEPDRPADGSVLKWAVFTTFLDKIYKRTSRCMYRK